MATVPGGVKVMRRAGEGREFVFLLNCTDAVAKAKLPRAGYTDALTAEPVAQELRLEPREVKVLRSLARPGWTESPKR